MQLSTNQFIILSKNCRFLSTFELNFSAPIVSKHTIYVKCLYTLKSRKFVEHSIKLRGILSFQQTTWILEKLLFNNFKTILSLSRSTFCFLDRCKVKYQTRVIILCLSQFIMWNYLYVVYTTHRNYLVIFIVQNLFSKYLVFFGMYVFVIK